MAEINNNNIQSFGYKKIEKIDKQEPIEKVIEQEIKPEEKKQYAPDTGVLGRSQVRPAKGANIPKTIEETVAIATEHPAKMGCSEGVWNWRYNDAIERGVPPHEAYMEALFAEEEFLEIAHHI